VSHQAKVVAAHAAPDAPPEGGVEAGRIPVVEAVVRLEMEVLPPLLVVLRELVAPLSHPLAPMLGRSCVVALDILPLTVQDAAREAPSVGGPLLPLPPERMHCRRFPLELVLRVQAGQVEAPLRVARHLRVVAHPRGLRQPSKVRGPRLLPQQLAKPPLSVGRPPKRCPAHSASVS